MVKAVSFWTERVKLISESEELVDEQILEINYIIPIKGETRICWKTFLDAKIPRPKIGILNTMKKKATDGKKERKKLSMNKIIKE